MSTEAIIWTLSLFLTIVHLGTSNPAVGFSAMLTHDTYLGNKQAIMYDKIISNYGNGYNKWSGHFTAPVKGLYVFSCTVMAYSSTHIHIDIVKNNKWIASVYASRYPWDQGSNTIVLPLKHGDKVWAGQARDGRHLYGHFNLFSGYLISTKI